jgi:type II restriction enzyme
MKIYFDKKIAEKYKNASQRIRVLSEGWVNNEVFCPACGCSIKRYTNNKPVADFFCANCEEDYELKSKKDYFGTKIVNGAYETMIQRLQSNNNPNFFFLNYSLDFLEIVNFLVIPKYFFVPQIIEKRKPLTLAARRSGWVGCNILLNNIPSSGRIFYIRNKKIESKKSVLSNWNKTLFLRECKQGDLKGWILDIMNCIDRIGKNYFSLSDIYRFESELKSRHPNNKHVKDKIRQQLQFLRDRGYIYFTKRGLYRVI